MDRPGSGRTVHARVRADRRPGGRLRRRAVAGGRQAAGTAGGAAGQAGPGSVADGTGRAPPAVPGKAAAARGAPDRSRFLRPRGLRQGPPDAGRSEGAVPATRARARLSGHRPRTSCHRQAGRGAIIWYGIRTCWCSGWPAPAIPGPKRRSANTAWCGGCVRRALLEVRLVTGKRNQIRLQAELRGHGLVGEQMYVSLPESARIAFPRQALHAWRLSFRASGHRADAAPRGPAARGHEPTARVALLIGDALGRVLLLERAVRAARHRLHSPRARRQVHAGDQLRPEPRQRRAGLGREQVQRVLVDDEPLGELVQADVVRRSGS